MVTQVIISYGFGPLCRTADMPINDPRRCYQIHQSLQWFDVLCRLRCVKDTSLNPGVFSHYQVRMCCTESPCVIAFFQVFVGLDRNQWSHYSTYDLYVILLMQALVLGHCCQRSWWICFVTPGSPIWFLLTYQHFDSYPAHWQLVQWLGIQSVDVPKVSEASQGGFAGSIATQSSTLVGEPGCVTPADFNFNISEPVS